jgi:uncharacterized protein
MSLDRSRCLHALCLAALVAVATMAAAPPAPTPTDAELHALVGDYQALAEQGDANAQYELGVKLQYGDQKDVAAALGWYRKAAAQGHVEAIESIGHCYYTGAGVKQDLAQAARWWRQAADKGNMTAQYWMGDFYDGGRGGLKEDPAEAVRWFRKAADQGDASSQYRLGDMYVRGRGVPQSDGEGVKWLQESAKKDDPNAQYSMGEMYRDGRGVAKDDEKATLMFRAAADQDSELAMMELGRGYEQGRGMKAPDPVCALFWYGFAEKRDRGWGKSEHDALAAKATPAQRADAERMVAATHFDQGVLQRPLCSDETMTFDIRGTELQDVLPVFRQLSAMPIVGLEGVRKVVKLQSDGATWQQALTLLLDGIGYRWERKGDVIQVTKKGK